MRRLPALLVAAALVLAGAGPAEARAAWKRRLDRLAAGHRIGIAVHQRGRFVYGWAAKRKRAPASNQKLIASMALFDILGPSSRLPTIAAARSRRRAVVDGSLWILGRGDPAVATQGRFARSLPLKHTPVGRLARRIARAGITSIRGGIRGSRGYFRHDWDAPGWRPYYRSLYVALPTALTFNGNTHRGRHVTDPERLLARALTRRLRALGVSVGRAPRSGRPPAGLEAVARVRSRPLRALLRYTNRSSSNFFAEVLGKRLAVAYRGRPGSIAGAGRALEAWARGEGVRIQAHDASGLSHANRVSARGLVRLLVRARRRPWGPALVRSLPSAGRGTLEDRLAGVRVRAKTGTLIGVSALSGWVWRRGRRTWAAFSILSRGMPKDRAVALEDRIVRLLARSPRPTTPSLQGRRLPA